MNIKPQSACLIVFPSVDLIPYQVARNHSTCTCQVFISGSWCNHLKDAGCYPKRSVTLSSKPNFYQALSGLVKGIRLRNLDEAAYWLTYCWSFKQKLNGAQFRIIRRLLIGSAEDGHSIAVMEKLADNYSALLSKDIDFTSVMAELVRICKVPNWWNPNTGGHDYIYSGMLATRKILYDRANYSASDCLLGLEQSIVKQNKVDALRWIIQDQESDAATNSLIARKLYELASTYDCQPAKRLIQNIYLRHEKSLKSDNNFLCQAAWILAGGNSPVIDQIEVVTQAEVNALIDKVNATKPYVIPGWCCDGVHCAGNDIRYAGMWDRMYAVCNQYNYYGRVIPDDPWLEDEFYCLDGLTVAEA